MATILEALRYADYNFRRHHHIPGVEASTEEIVMQVAKNRLHNAAALLEKGYSLYDEMDSILEKYGDVDNVPDYDE